MYNDKYNTENGCFNHIAKENKDDDGEDYRTILFMSHITKRRISIINERIHNKINKEVTEERFGFHENSDIRQTIRCFTNISLYCL